jgi:NADH:ubiquinone oxidoreductase subunit H
MKSRRLRAQLQLAALACACIFVLEDSACSPAPSREPPDQARALEIVPNEVELGDRVTILGDGFPPGTPAHVTFRGTLHRPGEQALRDSEVVVRASAVSPTRLEFAVDDVVEWLFCRAADRATHTTFKGDVEVSFAAPATGSSPVARLRNVTFDIRPSENASARDRQHEGERLLAWLGVKATGSPAGLVVEDVEVESRAQAAGIAAGDVVTGFDDVRVASAADVVPPPGQRSARVDLLERRTGGPQTRSVALRGFRRTSPEDWLAAMLCVLCALGAVWFFSSPTRPGFAAALQRVVSRLRARLGGRPTRWPLARAAITVARRTLPPWGPAALGDVVACSLLTLLPFGRYVVASRIDVWLLFVVAVVCLAAAAFSVRASAWKGLSAAAEVVWRHAPAASAVAIPIALTGSLRLREIGEAQGGWPWDWLALRSPISLLALGLLIDCSRIEPGGDDGLSPLATALEDTTSSGHGRGMRAWLDAACRVHRLILAGLMCVLFLGGWQLPGIPSIKQAGSPSLELAGAAWFLTKTWSVVILTAWVRWSMPRCYVGRDIGGSAISATLLTTLAVASTAAWIWWAPAPSLQHLVNVSLCVGVAMASAALAQRLHHGLTSGEGDSHLSPFL